MFIIECLPLTKDLNKESLSYFGPEYLEPGSLIKIKIRNKSVPALVLESKNASEAKTEIKSADFSLKKISDLTSRPFLQKEFLEAVKETAEYFAATCGNILYHLLPSFILENAGTITGGKAGHQIPSSFVSVLQSPDDERISIYRALIREEFAKKKSVFMCLPQNEDVKDIREGLERGIEPYVCAFHKDLKSSEIKKEIKKALESAHPVLIIGTARWLCLPRNDLGTIVVEKENESGWKTLSRPFFDLRFFAEKLAKNKGARFVLGDSFLRTETLWRYKNGEVSEMENVKWRLPKEVETFVIDSKKTAKKEKEFKILSPELTETIKDNIEKSSNMFIFALRKGLSSVTVCRDCGTEVGCNNCSSPMILHKTGKGNAFVCHQCGEIRGAAETCRNCGSWRLAAFGAGIDRLADEIKKNFPQIKLFGIHKDVVPTRAKAQKILGEFYKTRGAILLGTEMAFSYMHKKVANSAIASLDSLFSVPDFRIREKIFRLILKVRSLAREKFLIQTRDPDDSTIEYAISGNLAEFYKKEIGERDELNYPPFSVFIKITVRGGRNMVLRETENMKRVFEKWNPVVFASIQEKKGEQAAINAVLKLAKNKWPFDYAQGKPDDLANILKSLPPYFEIKVDPDNLL